MNEGTKKIFSATATPLASIFGSGFLVIVPILNGAVGPYSLIAMAGICGLAYGVGCVIRYNIRPASLRSPGNPCGTRGVPGGLLTAGFGHHLRYSNGTAGGVHPDR